MIEAEGPGDGGTEILIRDLHIFRTISSCIGFSINRPADRSASSKEAGTTERMMIPPRILIDERGSAELRRQDHQGAFQLTRNTEIFEQRGPILVFLDEIQESIGNGVISEALLYPATSWDIRAVSKPCQNVISLTGDASHPEDTARPKPQCAR